jgi:uncharacterized UPF0160 family protein
MDETIDEEAESFVAQEEEKEQPHQDDSLNSPGASRAEIAVPPFTFSAEDAAAVMLLRWIPRFAGLAIRRTQDQEVCDRCVVRISVAPYDHSGRSYSRQANLRYGGLPESMGPCGLVFYHYADEALASRLHVADADDQRFVKSMLYSTLIEDLDKESGGDLRKLAAALDPADDSTPKEINDVFEILIDLFSEQFEQKLSWITRKFIPQRITIRKAMQERKKTLQSGEILVLPHYVPLEMHQDLISGDEPKKHQIKFIAMPRMAGEIGVYALRWRPNFRRLKIQGQRDEHSGSIAGFNGQGWIHPQGTIGTWNTMQFALEYLKQTLKVPDKTALPSLNQ